MKRFLGFVLTLVLLLSCIPSQVLADDGCVAPDGGVCIPPPGHENEPIAPPIDSLVILPSIENSSRPPGHENDPIAQLVQPPSIENSPRPPHEINYLKLERFDDETFTEKRFTRHRN
jgi:hypothetical protein